jgi:APA family basic amino acid/polyamine antiporter
VLAVLACITMMGPVIIDIVGKALAGEWIPSAILVIYIVIGALIYVMYGYHHSRMRLAARR